MTFQTERRTLRSECCAAIFLFRLFGIVVFSQDRLTLTYKWDSMSGSISVTVLKRGLRGETLGTGRQK